MTSLVRERQRILPDSPNLPHDIDRPASPTRAHLDRGLRLEQSGALERALDAYNDALAGATADDERAEAHLRIARVYRTMTRWNESTRESSEAIRFAEAAGADDLVAEAMNVEVGALQMQGFFDAADTIAVAALDRARSARVRGITLQNLGRGAAERRDFQTSDRYFNQSIDCFRAANYDVGLAIALGNAGKAALDRGDANRAAELGEEAIALARRLNALDILLTSVQNQAAAFVALGRHQAAEALLTEALGHFTSANNLIRQAECLEIMGEMSERRPSDGDTAQRCYRRALELATRANDRTLIDRLTERLGIGSS